MVELKTRRTYSERALERDKVALDTVDSVIRDSGLAILEDRGDVDGLPLDRGLYSHLAHCPFLTRQFERAGTLHLRQRRCP